MPTSAPAATGRRRRALQVAGVVVLVLVAALAWTAYRSVLARSHLERARTALTTAKDALLNRDLPTATAAVERAGEQTRQARDLTGDPVVVATSHLPVLGRSVAVLRGIAAGSDDLARTVLPRALVGAKVLDPATVRRADGSIDLALLAKARPDIAASAHEADGVRSRVAALPGSLLPGPVGSALGEFKTQTRDLADALDGANSALEVAPGLLGADRPRRWFVLVQQTSESRGTGGLPGGFAILETDKGKLTVTRQGSNADLTNGDLPPVGLPTAYVDRYADLGAFDIWQNVNVSPDLPVVSRYIAQRWKAQSGQSIDGVIALDARALADLLQGSGPVQVAPGQQVAPDGIEDYLALGQYRRNPGQDQTGRKEELTVVASAVIDRLTGGGGDSTSLLRGLSSAVRTGHLRVATQDATLAPVLRRTGADGGLPTDARPFTYPVVFNASGSKLEYFLDRTVRYTGEGCSGSSRRTTVRVTLRTDPPALAELPSYVTIRLDDGKKAHSLVDRLGLSVYATKGARLQSATLDGKDVTGELRADTEAGLPVWLTYLDLPPHQDRVLELHLLEPTAKGAPRVLEQPLARDQRSSTDLAAC